MKKRILLGTAALLAFGLAVWALFAWGRGEKLLDQLPDGYWLDFDAWPVHVTGDGKRLTGAVCSRSVRPENYTIPSDADQEYLTPDTVRSALKSCRVEPGQEIEGFSLAEPWKHFDDYYILTLTDGGGERWAAVIAGDGTIVLRRSSDSQCAFFRDRGGAYSAMKSGFGDALDLEQCRGGCGWNVYTKDRPRPEIRGEHLLDKLPEGYWYRMSCKLIALGEEGGYRVNGTALDRNAPVGEPLELPEGLEYLTPDTVKEALKERKVEQAPENQYLSGLRDVEMRENLGIAGYFLFFFQDAEGTGWRLTVTDTGLIGVETGWTYGENHITGVSEVYTDSGECYQALKKAFGDAWDVKSWRR